MDIFDALNLVGGLCLFLFGMNVMGNALERRAGGKLESLLGRLTTGKIAGLLTGLGVTAVIQSSSATTVMVVGFVNSGLMTLRQAINVIMGANIGTTVTAWILSLGGIQGDNIFLKLLKPTSFTPVLALVGIVFYMFCKSDKKRDTGTILLGFAVLMFGMQTMSDAVSGLADIPQFQKLFLMFKNPILGVLAGALLTALIQSSSASVGILQALSSTGQVSYGAAIPIIMGQNIGTCITAILSSFGTNRNAKRAAVVHLSFNVIGTIVWLSVYSAVNAIFAPALFSQPAPYAGIAVAHSVFNILCTMLLLPLTAQLEKLAYFLIPETKTPDVITQLDERLLATPAVALETARSLTNQMATGAIGALHASLDCLQQYDEQKAHKIREIESETDHFEDIIGSYLVKLSSRQISDEHSMQAAMLLKAIGDLERISDHSVNLVESAEEMKSKGYSFSDEAKAELHNMIAAINEILDYTQDAFTNEDLQAACKVEPLEQVVDKLKNRMRSGHIKRLQKGLCSIETGFVWSDILTNLERTSDHCSNIAGWVLEAEANNLNIHEGTRVMHHKDPHYRELYKEFLQKYYSHAQ